MPIRAPNPFAGWQEWTHHALAVLFLASLVLVWVRLRSPGFLVGEAHWPDGLLLLATVGATLASLSRQLPAQNVFLCAVLIGFIGGGISTLGAIAGVPFGPVVYNKEKAGQFLLPLLPWSVPIIWVVIILTSRGVARLMLRRFRRRPNYGFWVMGITVLLVVIFEVSLEPYATILKEYWSWKPTKLASTWYTTPWVNFVGWAVSTLLILLFVTPALINKSPVPKPVTLHPLLVWEALSFLFLWGTAERHLWVGVSFVLGQMVVVAALVLLGAKRKSQQHGSCSTDANSVTYSSPA